MRISPAPCAKSSASGSAKVSHARRHGHLGEAAEHAERGDAVAGLEARAGGALRTTPADLAARDERQRRLDLVLPARLQQLGEGDARGAHVDHHALARRHRMRGLGLRDVDELERRVGARQVRDLDRAHGRAARYRFAHHRVSTP